MKYQHYKNFLERLKCYQCDGSGRLYQTYILSCYVCHGTGLFHTPQQTEEMIGKYNEDLPKL